MKKQKKSGRLLALFACDRAQWAVDREQAQVRFVVGGPMKVVSGLATGMTCMCRVQRYIYRAVDFVVESTW